MGSRFAAPKIDLVGRQFGKWTVVSYAGRARWQCRCTCGRVVDVAEVLITSERKELFA